MIIENIIVASVIIAGGFLTTLIPIIIGAVKKRSVIKPVEYLPPRGASPLDFLIQYYGAAAQPREIFNPLMLYWAERGFITIEEDCKRGLILTKIKDIAPPREGVYDYESYDTERRLFDCLFLGSRKVFYTLAALSEFSQEYLRITSEVKKQAKKVTAEKSKGCKIASLAMSFAMLAAVILIVGVSTGDKVIMTAIFPFVAIAFPKFILYFFASGDDGIPKGSAVRFLFLPFFLMFGGVPFAVLVSELPAAAAIVVATAFAVCVLNVFILSEKIDIRSSGQLKFYGSICGFKKFLLLAEVRQLEALVEDNPRYYYNILPYCYILKITEKLKPKFDSIALDGPAWYLGELRETLMF